MRNILLFLFFTFCQIAQTNAQRSASEIKLGLEKLNVLGSVLYFAAHPDDENTRLIAWLANEKKYRTSYLSLTRGDGGQNLIGNELGIELGLIRTQELLAARNIDGGEQYFSSAYDFGFSKTYEETFQFWNKEETLREAVWIIRSLRPDVIINRFPPDKRGGHGHHQASAILSHEAFIAAADPNRFPEQLNKVDLWQAKRLLWNTANFGGQNNTSEDQLKIEIGSYNPLLGISYGEMAAESRSQHKSQGFGSLPTRGRSFEYFEHVAGDEATETLFDEVTADWSRLDDTKEITTLVAKLNEEFNVSKPQQSIDDLVKLHHMVRKIQDDYWKEVKLGEIERLILDCAGFHIDNYTNQADFAVGTSYDVSQDIIVRNPEVDVTIISIDGNTIKEKLSWNQTFSNKSKSVFEIITQPYWLNKPYTIGKFDVDEEDFGHAENKSFPRTSIDLEINGLAISLQVPTTYRYLDPVRGEIKDPIRIVPSLTASTDQNTILINDERPKTLAVTFTQQGKGDKEIVFVETPQGVEATPSQVELNFENQNSFTQVFEIKATKPQQKTSVLSFRKGEEKIKQYKTISYDHIPTISWFPDLNIKIQPIDIQVPVKRVAYIAGAGDLVPESLRSIGIQVEEISPNKISKESLSPFDAVVFGVRAYNIYPNLFNKHAILMNYVQDGGIVVVQYNVNSQAIIGDKIGPFPFDVTRARVTEEDADVNILLPKDPVLQYPNPIGAADFEHWVQERGLYFLENTADAYRRPLGMHDRDEKEHDGSLIVADHGKGRFVYTSLSFFRQLPAGVPGAYRLFVNLLSKED